MTELPARPRSGSLAGRAGLVRVCPRVSHRPVHRSYSDRAVTGLERAGAASPPLVRYWRAGCPPLSRLSLDSACPYRYCVAAHFWVSL